MYNVIIFGTGSTAEIVMSALKDNVNVVCFVDNDTEKWGEYFKEKIIYNPKYISELEYDFLIIASQYDYDIYFQLINMGVNKEKIFQYISFSLLINNRFNYRIKQYAKSIQDYKTLITGISYFASGINGDALRNKGINFAFDSQDIYYDYNIAKYILKNYNHSISNCIIGLSYYSFEYDMSLSSMKNNVNLYYKILKKSHNFQINISIDEMLELGKIISNKLFKMSYKDKKNELYYGFYYENKKLDNSQKCLKILGKRQAIIDCKKNFPKTVKENTLILDEYLKLLKNNNIMPIIVISPVIRYYGENFDYRIKEQFFDIINKMKQKYEFQYLDFFDSKYFNEEDFRDVTHLNINGNKKFTELLNKSISWIDIE